MRRFALVLFACAVMWGSESLALGLGEIRVKTAFNRNFMAVVPVFLDGGEADVKAEVGRQEDYTLLQVGRPAFVDGFQLAVGDDPDRPGAKAIIITSKEPISQPSFNLVIRASAGGGSILENYFLAVDFRKSLSLDLPEPEEKKAEAPKPPVEQAVETAAVVPPVIVQAPPPVVEQAMVQPLPETPPATPTPEPQKPEEQIPAASVIVREQEPVEQKPEPKPEIAPKAEPPPSPSPVPASIAEVRAEEPVEQPLPAVPVLVKTGDDPASNVVKVRGGDTLFSIARRLNAQKTDLARVVVAIYLANRESFIGPNIHGLKRGASLSYQKVNEIAATVTAEEAHAILDRDWKAWKNPEQSAVAEIPVERAVPAEEVFGFIEGWKKRWMTKNPALEDDYADDFRGPGNARKAEWMAAKREIAESNTNINLAVENVRMARSGASIIISFTQTLRSDQYFSTGLKTLQVKPVPGGLKIADERFKASRSEDMRKTWSVQVATYASRTMASAHIRTLAARGIAAFEAGVAPDAPGHAVLAGRLSTREAARGLANRLLGMGEKNLKVVRFPFSLRVGMYATRNEAETAVAKLAKDGHAPFVAECVTDGKAQTAVYLGAFATKEEAEKAKEELAATGYAPQAVIP